jgi:type I restriction-modification system DNA methylase subunit
MSFFQKSILNKYLKIQDQESIDVAFKKFSEHFLNTKMQKEIRDMKEEEYQDGFLDDLFVNVLGYTKRPKDGYNLIREKKNETNGKKADGAVLQNDLPLAVIELKGTETTDLDKVSNQAFGYKNNHTNCVYVITSNFEKLRFFIHNSVEHIEFNLFTLTKDDFALLWLCLQADNLIGNIPLKVKEESVVREEAITKKLYSDYSSFKNELWQNACQNAPEKDKLILFKKTQKLLDRFLFIFFAEDSGLLPPNSITRMVDRYEQLIELDAKKPLYEIFKQYFSYINKGRLGKTNQDNIFAYNGGLFVHDDELEDFKIDDDLLKKHVLKLTAYDFQSEVDVNILGHIFENSLNEIENVTAMLEGQEIDKSTTKRKKDGVFYTPKYITKYIVESTLGKICKAKKIEYNIIDERFALASKRSKKGINDLKLYRDWLLSLKICDPACGSGAFLNQALEFLIDEHQYLDELTAKYHKAALILSDIEGHILEKNLYGVDINEESIEISKLSLWLRTAQRGRKLTSLNNNIKCGNSIIKDQSIAGEKAFNWQKEFPEVFKNGGFDVIIGNPPYISYYGRFKNPMNKATETYFKNNYDFIGEENRIIDKNQIKGKFNTIMFFLELSSKIAKNISLIIDLNFSKLPYRDIRKYLAEHCCIDEVILNITGWSDVGSGQILITFSSEKKVEQMLLKNDFFEFESQTVDQKDIVSFFTKGSATNSLIEKLASNHFTPLSNWYPKKLIRTSINFGAQKSIFLVKKDSELAKPLAEGSDSVTAKYFPPEIKTFINYDPDIIHKINRENDKESIAIKNKQGKVGGLGDPIVFKNPKIIIRQAGANLCATYFKDELYLDYSLFSISNKNSSSDISHKSLYLTLSILNSKLLNYYAWEKNIIEHQKGGTPQMRIKGLRSLPMPKEIPEPAASELISYAKSSIEKANEIHKLNTVFNNLLCSKFETTSKLDLNGTKNILDYFKSNTIKLPLSEEAEWSHYFNEQKQKVTDQKLQILVNDSAINKLVYNLYGLTNKEIEIVESK